MKFQVTPSSLSGSVPMPGSKSHTIRGLVMALLAHGTSTLQAPLDSSDTRSALDLIRSLGAEVVEQEGQWLVTGMGLPLDSPGDVINVGNSGTSLYLGMGIASLIEGMTVFTGDHQIRNRPADVLVTCINDLGGKAWSTRYNGKPPLVIQGPVTGGVTSVEAVTSQYLSALLLSAPFAKGETTIYVPLLNEKPYVTMTLGWLDFLGLSYENHDYKTFVIKGGQSIKPFERYIPADFSSATFFMVAAAITGSTITLEGLDFNDTQGDRQVVEILQEMGARVDINEQSITIEGRELTGGEFDLNSIPDALPALAVAACCAKGETRLVNVAQARVKETDRIAVMSQELEKMGAQVTERDDGLVIQGSPLSGTEVQGHHDHRVVMALAVAGLAAKGTTVIDTAEAAAVTFPGFRKLMESLGAAIQEKGD